MADPKHVERLKQSVKKWNTWREKHQDVRPALSNVDLSGTNLSGANLRGAYLHDANLSGANLSGADLSDNTNFSASDLSGANLRDANLASAHFSYANLRDTDLRGANLNGASLSNTDLSHSNLLNSDLRHATLFYADLSGAYLLSTDLEYTNFSGANLSGAILLDAHLHHTNLSGANLHRAIFSHTSFRWTDLSNLKGLETAEHIGPSSVDINSVVLPHNESTRLHFLRGVGFTETQIEYLPSLLTPRPIEYHSLFISYAHQDEAIAKRLYTDLRKKDVPCWFAPHDLRPGTPILRGIEEAIHMQDKFLLILSEYAVSSAWIEREVDAALHQEIQRGQDVLFPIRLDNAVLESHAGWAARLQHRHIGNFTGWRDEKVYYQAFATLLRHLKVAQALTP